MSSIQNITILVPLYNEERGIIRLIERLDKLIDQSAEKISVLFIDDGSKDNTAVLLEKNIEGKENYSALFLSRNFGHAQALTAGLQETDHTNADAVFIIDGDLQDPPELLPSFLQKLKEGYDVVYGIRKNRKEGFLKRICYKIYYRLQHRFASINMPLDAGDFSLITKRIVKIMNSLPEESRYIRGLRSWVGYKQAGIEYERDERIHGTSKYNLLALFKLAFNGIFNFSELPIRFIVTTGIVSIGFSLVYLGITVYKKLIYGTVPEGFTALIFAIVLFSGVQLLSLGIIGQYVVRIFFQVKQRPLFIVKSRIINGKPADG
ncbi:MAG: glycosyltransferase family 2 protein [Ferruginibacter sp.]